MDVQSETIAFFREPMVCELTGLSRSVLRRRITDGLFSAPLKIGRRCAAWPRHEVAAINRAVLRAASDDELRALVAELHTARRAAG